MDLGQFQNNIESLPDLNDLRYENIFKVYKNPDNFYYYNITKTVTFPDNLDPTQFFYYRVRRKMPWTMVSFNIYNTIELWWLLCLINKIKNPVKVPKTGTLIKALLPDRVSSVLAEIKNQLK
ncbi:MAG: hypothetical protein EBU90_06620 [Proteobacteria bacterium]|nr:hypothetical protein [Pseudomonadota bacterium]NBP15069.1 hypothetical protein [bacterium]